MMSLGLILSGGAGVPIVCFALTAIVTAYDKTAAIAPHLVPCVIALVVLMYILVGAIYGFVAKALSQKHGNSLWRYCLQFILSVSLSSIPKAIIDYEFSMVLVLAEKIQLFVLTLVTKPLLLVAIMLIMLILILFTGD